jgi:hypothetical protein
LVAFGTTSFGHKWTGGYGANPLIAQAVNVAIKGIVGEIVRAPNTTLAIASREARAFVIHNSIGHTS